MKIIKSYKKISTKNKKSDIFPHVMTSFRHLIIVSFFLILRRFDRALQRVDFSTLMNDLRTYKFKNLSAKEILIMIRRTEDLDINTKLKKLKFLFYDLFKLRYILNQIHTYVLPQTSAQKPKKLLITKDVFLIIFFYETVLKFIYIDAEVLHAKLIDIEKIHLIQKFNDSEDFLTILIIMYQVSAQKINLDFCCHRIIVSISAINAFSEIQI